ncbi:tetracycline resistance protein [Klebsiella pneumoniae]|nr:tetracycline resistance protein [Klebsiella pneumoniae]
MTVVAALMAVFFIMQLVGQVPAALWVIFGEDRFHWDATTIGISLAAFGIRDTGMDGVPDHGPACFGWHRNAGAASNVVQAGG